MLRAARNPIECAFGLLKARWALLNKKLDLSLSIIPTVVYACFLLHNLCERNQTYINEEILKKQIQIATAADKEILPDHIFVTMMKEKLYKKLLQNT